MPLPSDDDPIVTVDDGEVTRPSAITNEDIYAVLSKVLRTSERTENFQLQEVIPRLDRLDMRVFGSKPPPLLIYASADQGELDLPAAKPSSPPLTKRATLNEANVASLTQELANLREVVETNAKASKTELGQQSRAMGLPPVVEGKPPPGPSARTRAYIFSRAGVKDLILLVGLVTAAAGSIATALRPLPALAPAAPTSIVAPPTPAR